MFPFPFLLCSSIVIVIILLHTFSIPLVSPLIVLTWLTNILIIPKFPSTPYLYLYQWGQACVEKNLLTDFTLKHSHYIFFISSLSLLLDLYFILFLSLQTYARISLPHLTLCSWTFSYFSEETEAVGREFPACIYAYAVSLLLLRVNYIRSPSLGQSLWLLY